MCPLQGCSQNTVHARARHGHTTFVRSSVQNAKAFGGGGAGVVSSGGAPTPAGTSVFTKHNWDMGMGYLWLNGWGIYHLMGGAFMAYWVGHL